jgi:hypothetical protein
MFALAHMSGYTDDNRQPLGVAVLSERERRTLAEIERHLEEDERLRTFAARSQRRARRMRRLWILLVIASAVLVIGMGALGSTAGAADSLLLGAVSAACLYFNPPRRQKEGRQADGPGTAR